MSEFSPLNNVKKGLSFFDMEDHNGVPLSGTFERNTMARKVWGERPFFGIVTSDDIPLFTLSEDDYEELNFDDE